MDEINQDIQVKELKETMQDIDEDDGSEELKDIERAYWKWRSKYCKEKGNVCMMLSCMAFDKEYQAVEDMRILFFPKFFLDSEFEFLESLKEDYKEEDENCCIQFYNVANREEWVHKIKEEIKTKDGTNNR